MSIARLAPLLLIVVTACTTPPPPPPPAIAPPAAVAPAPIKESNAVHWFRDSAEQSVLYASTYEAATRAVTAGTGTPAAGAWGVILDVDETVLDNSEYQKRLDLNGGVFTPDTWTAWVKERAATPLPGAKRFIDAVKAVGGHVVLVTNRVESVCPATEENLKAASIQYDLILCAPEGTSDKNPRFAAVAAGTAGPLPPLTVRAWVGDNIMDFPALSQANAGDVKEFGSRYFLLPNPMYGSWAKNPSR